MGKELLKYQLGDEIMKKFGIFSQLLVLMFLVGLASAVPQPLIDLNAENLPEGQLNGWVNEGPVECVFLPADRPEVEGVDPNAVVEQVAGRKAVTFADGAWLQSDITTPDALTGSNPWSVLVWAYAPSTTGEDCLFQWADRGGSVNAATAHFNFGTRVFTNFFNDLFYTSPPPLNQWVHLAMTYDGTNVRVYVNGIADTVAALALNIAQGHYMRIARAMPDMWGTHPFPGSIASIQVYDTALSQQEIQELGGVFEAGSIGPAGLRVVEGQTVNIELQIYTNPLTGQGPQEDLEVTLSVIGTWSDVVLGDAEVGQPYTVVVPAADYALPVSIPVTAYDDDVFQPAHTVLIQAVVTAGDPDYVGKILTPASGLGIRVIDDVPLECPPPQLIGGAYVDNFDCAADYLSFGTEGSLWSGLLDNGENTIEATANMSAANALRLSSSNSYWGGNDTTGPFLYVEVTGDFEIETYIADYPEVYFNDGGLMIRLADTAAGGDGEDNIQLSYFPLYGVGNVLRWNNNGARTETDQTFDGWDAAPYLKLVRRGANFYAYNSFDGVNWLASFPSASPENPLVREDMNVSTLQVGLYHATFSAAEGYIDYGYFALKKARGVVTGELFLNEGDSGTVQLQLFAEENIPAPTTDMQLTLRAIPAAGADPNSDPNAILIGDTPGALPYTLVVPAAEYDQPLDIPITAAMDSLDVTDHLLTIEAQIASSDPNWNELLIIPESRVTVFETPGLFLDTTDEVFVLEGGYEGIFTVRLKVPPQAPVTVSITEQDPAGQVTVWPQELAFDQTNWKIPQGVTVTAIDDDLLETDPHAATLLLTASDGGIDYDDLEPLTVSVTIYENNCGAWGYFWADINQDCRVDIVDLSLVVEEWLTCSRPHDPDCIDYR
jgi:hypothetical protein